MSHTVPNKNKRKATFLHGQELKCKNDCGFYGNPEWQGYCSKCNRQLNQSTKSKHGVKSSSKKIVRSQSDAHESTESLRFTKFEEKKKQQSEKRSKTIKSIIKRGNTSKESVSSPSQEFMFHGDFLLAKEFNLSEAATKDINKHIQLQLDLMNKHLEKPIDEQSEIMQEFYQFMSNRCETHPAYQDMPVEQVEVLMDKVEKLLMIYLYRPTFQQISSEYEEKDLALQNRIRNLNWITSQHLGTDIKDNSPEVRELIDKAITDIIEMDSKQAPQEKLGSIVNCSKNIFNIIVLCQDAPASADDFLPAMVYIILKANPPLLQSNIKYITSYSVPTRMMSGESGYYFTNLCCAVEFIEKLTAESLNLNTEEFERYLSGEAVPSGYNEQNAVACEGLRLMYQNLSTLTELHSKHDKLIVDILALQDDMTKFKDNIFKSVPPPLQCVINLTPYTVPSDVNISLIPEILRDRIIREGVKEDILVDLECNSQIELTTAENNKGTNSDTAPSPELQNMTLQNKLELLTGDVFMEDEVTLKPFVTELTCKAQKNESIVSEPLHTIPSSDSFSQHDTSQCGMNIKDLVYPTEVFPDHTSDSTTPLTDDSLNYLYNQSSCEQLIDNSPLSSNQQKHPLSPETGFMEENLNLPPPLLPLVVQAQSSDKNCEPNSDASLN